MHTDPRSCDLAGRLVPKHWQTSRPKILIRVVPAKMPAPMQYRPSLEAKQWNNNAIKTSAMKTCAPCVWELSHRITAKESTQTMSDTGTNTKADNDAATEFADKYTKKGKAVALANDDLGAFVEFTDTIGKDNYKDWTVGAPENFTGLAMVETEGKANRLIALPSKEAMMADATVMAALYRVFINRIVNTASDNDAQAAQFLTVAGCFKQKFDVEAFNFQAKALGHFLREQGLSGVTKNNIRNSFASAAFAKTQFPRIADAAWLKIIAIAEANAAKNGLDTTIFDHWKATRAVQTADTSEIQLDFDALQKAEDAIGTEETNKPAA